MEEVTRLLLARTIKHKFIAHSLLVRSTRVITTINQLQVTTNSALFSRTIVWHTRLHLEIWRTLKIKRQSITATCLWTRLPIRIFSISIRILTSSQWLPLLVLNLSKLSQNRWISSHTLALSSFLRTNWKALKNRLITGWTARTPHSHRSLPRIKAYQ